MDRILWRAVQSKKSLRSRKKRMSKILFRRKVRIVMRANITKMVELVILGNKATAYLKI